MSAKYQDPRHVPLEKLTERLGELADAITRGGESMDRELTMRVPAECDRDADLVISEAASRLTRLQSEVERLSDYIILNGDRIFSGDWACAQCHPNSDILVDGFECGFHLAQRLRQQAAESEGGKENA